MAHRFKKWIILIVLGLLIGVGIFGYETLSIFHYGKSVIQLEVLISHRGGAGPENTIEAYDLAIKRGYRILEADIKITMDEIPVLLHDLSIDRTSNGTGNVQEMTFDKLRTYDFGSWYDDAFVGTLIPPLDEFLTFCREKRIVAELDLVNDNIATDKIKVIYDVVATNNMLYNTIFTVTLEQAKVLEQMNSNLILCITGIVDEESLQKALSSTLSCKMLLMSIPYEYLEKDLCKKCHDNNCIVKTWTVNNVLDVREALSIGADLVITDKVTKNDLI